MSLLSPMPSPKGLRNLGTDVIVVVVLAKGRNLTKVGSEVFGLELDELLCLGSQLRDLLLGGCVSEVQVVAYKLY